MSRRAIAAAVVLVIASACGAPAVSAPAPAQIHVTPSSGLVDSPLTITVTGLQPRHAVTLTATTRGLSGRVYQDSATYMSDGVGALDLATAAPTSGKYKGAQTQGLIWYLACACTTVLDTPAVGARISLSASEDGTVVATAEVTRSLSSAGVTVTTERPSTSGFYADYFAPAGGGGARPAVLLFGGSAGGLELDLEASLLASHGYPALSLAYFNEPGLPVSLGAIPLEYFVTALTWLSRQPGVDPTHLVVQGASRGSEAALLLGVHFPQLVHGVIALVPNDAALCAFPKCAGPAWTLGGAPLPYTSQFNQVDPTDDPAALIAVEDINGPILLDCGDQDETWDSCGFATELQSRLTASPHAHTLLRYPDGDHGVGYLPPNYPVGCCEADYIARVDLWAHVLDFLSHL